MNIYERLEIDVGSLRYPYRRRIGITMFSYAYRLIPISIIIGISITNTVVVSRDRVEVTSCI